MPAYLLALDQGTSSSRALLFDREGQLVAGHQEAFALDYPEPGWVEVDARLLWDSLRRCLEAVLPKAGVPAHEVHAIGLTNQRETVVAWDRDSGEPVGPAIVWQCRRTADACAALRGDGHEVRVRELTGLVLDPYFSATKMAWILANRPEARRLADVGRLCLGTIDAWIVWQLSGGDFLTDASNASRTLLFDLQRGDWSEELLALFAIPRTCLPEIVPSSATVGSLDARFLGARIPIAGIAGDQQAALFGQACFAPGMAKNTYGTGCFLLMQTGPKPVTSQHGLLGTLAWRIGGVDTYALEGSVFVAGALIQWLRDGLGVLRDADESEALARQVPDSGGVHIVPAFTGLGAPHWDAGARGLIAGLTRGSTRAHLARAALDAVAFQVDELIAAMQADAGPLAELRVDGGMTRNDLLLQIQADLLDVPVLRPREQECTALGAAWLAGLATGVYGSLAEIGELWRRGRRFDPAIPADERARRRADWRIAVQRARS
jgi:glycerol kinase